MKKDTLISTKINQALYKLQDAELRMFRGDLLSALNYVEEAKRLILSEINAKFAIDS